MEKEEINIPLIMLEWSKWFPWNDLQKNSRRGNGVKIPMLSGVYEAKYRDIEERLTIGKASKLRNRIKRLVKGHRKHSTGKRILANEDVSKIVVRWAITSRKSAVEEELHMRYRVKFGKPPKHTKAS